MGRRSGRRRGDCGGDDEQDNGRGCSSEMDERPRRRWGVWLVGVTVREE
jgi:hypothetical protein